MVLLDQVLPVAIVLRSVCFYVEATPVPDLDHIVAAIPEDFVHDGFIRSEERVLGVLKKTRLFLEIYEGCLVTVLPFVAHAVDRMTSLL